MVPYSRSKLNKVHPKYWRIVSDPGLKMKMNSCWGGGGGGVGVCVCEGGGSNGEPGGGESRNNQIATTPTRTEEEGNNPKNQPPLGAH